MIYTKIALVLSFLFFGMAPVSSAFAAYAELPVVESVDLARYQGLWYEVARLPQRFENGCTGVTAEYTPLANGKIRVTNTCRKDSRGCPSAS